MKAKVYEYCQEVVSKRIQRIKKQLLEISEALKSETKSSAGDKHETGRAMMQLEREKLGNQLFEAEKILQQLQRIPLDKPVQRVSLGSLVKTNVGHYFISVSAGEYHLKDEIIFCVSSNAPIAKLLLGKSVGDAIEINAKEQQILKIL